MGKRRKTGSKAFLEKVLVVRGNRRKRDSIFNDVFVLALGELGQFEKMTEWVYEELDDARCVVDGLMPLAESNASRAALENLNLRVQRLNSTFTNELLKIDKHTLDKEDDATPEIKIDRAFNLLFLRVIPMVKELFLIRHDLDEMYEAFCGIPSELETDEQTC